MSTSIRQACWDRMMGWPHGRWWKQEPAQSVLRIKTWALDPDYHGRGVSFSATWRNLQGDGSPGRWPKRAEMNSNPLTKTTTRGLQLRLDINIAWRAKYAVLFWSRRWRRVTAGPLRHLENSGICQRSHPEKRSGSRYEIDIVRPIFSQKCWAPSQRPSLNSKAHTWEYI